MFFLNVSNLHIKQSLFPCLIGRLVAYLSEMKDGTGDLYFLDESDDVQVCIHYLFMCSEGDMQNTTLSTTVCSSRLNKWTWQLLKIQTAASSFQSEYHKQSSFFSLTFLSAKHLYFSVKKQS